MVILRVYFEAFAFGAQHQQQSAKKKAFGRVARKMDVFENRVSGEGAGGGGIDLLLC